MINQIKTPSEFFNHLGMKNDDDLSEYLENNTRLKMWAYDNIRGYDPEDESDGPFIDFGIDDEFTGGHHFDVVELQFPIVGKDLKPWEILSSVIKQVEEEYKEFRSDLAIANISLTN